MTDEKLRMTDEKNIDYQYPANAVPVTPSVAIGFNQIHLKSTKSGSRQIYNALLYNGVVRMREA